MTGKQCAGWDGGTEGITTGVCWRSRPVLVAHLEGLRGLQKLKGTEDLKGTREVPLVKQRQEGRNGVGTLEMEGQDAMLTKG